jgi:hypothetical protein
VASFTQKMATFTQMAFIYANILRAVFGCTEFGLGIELGKDSKSKMEMNWTKIPNLLFGCA